MKESTLTRVCGHCYVAIRNGEYEPYTFITGTCDSCGDETFVHRISKAELTRHIERVLKGER
jgi:hypothetical protein